MPLLTLYRIPISNGKGTTLNAEDYRVLDIPTRLCPVTMCRIQYTLLVETTSLAKIIEIDLDNYMWQVVKWKLHNIHGDGQSVVGMWEQTVIVLK